MAFSIIHHCAKNGGGWGGYATVSNVRILKAPSHCTLPLPIRIVITALVLRDKMLAHSTYRNQWTSSGEKKLVVDASKVKLVLGFLLKEVVVVIM